MRPSIQDRYLAALTFAARAHGEQKTPTGLPYVTHLAAVAMELMMALAEERHRDAHLAVPCALLHDVLEDTAVPRAALEGAFGAEIAAGVAALTKDARLPKAERMQDSLRRILEQPPEIAMVKLADRITNLAPPPPHWSAEKVAAYRIEAELILETLGHASPHLSDRLRTRLVNYPR